MTAQHPSQDDRGWRPAAVPAIGRVVARTMAAQFIAPFRKSRTAKNDRNHAEVWLKHPMVQRPAKRRSAAE